jgi:hypothetical protein
MKVVRPGGEGSAGKFLRIVDCGTGHGQRVFQAASRWAEPLGWTRGATFLESNSVSFSVGSETIPMAARGSRGGYRWSLAFKATVVPCCPPSPSIEANPAVRCQSAP